MKLIKERSITVVFDAVSISKDIEILGGSLTQNFYSESRTYIPNRFITPISLIPKIYIVDPNNIIPSGDKHEELLECIWYEDGNKIITNDEYKLNKDNTLTVLKNSEKDFTISYSAKWLDPRKKQIITIEDSVQFVTIALGDGNIKPRLTLDKAQNWIHNPLKNERIYSIKAYVSKDKLYEGAVEWYCTLKGAEKKLIDTSFLFYEGGQYSNELKVNSAYMPDCIITAKNISDNKLKEIYWFFDKQGNPLTYATPDKTIIEGSNVFSLPESPITSKLDYKIEGLTLTNLVKNGDFRNGVNGWGSSTPKLEPHKIIGFGNNKYMSLSIPYTIDLKTKLYVLFKDVVLDNSISERVNISIDGNILSPILKPQSNIKYSLSTLYEAQTLGSGIYLTNMYENKEVIQNKVMMLESCTIINLTQAFGAGNEPTKEWCDEHIQGYFEGTKSVTAPLRIKSVGENLFNNEYFRNKNNYSYRGNYIEAYTVVEPNTTYRPKLLRSKNVDYSQLGTVFLMGDKNNAATGDYTSIAHPAVPNNIKPIKTSENGRIYVKGLLIDKNTNIQSILKAVSTTDVSLSIIKPTEFKPYTESNLYLNNQLELKSVGAIKDYIENGKLYKYISDDGEILEQPEIVNLSTNGSLTTYPNGTIFLKPATLVEKQYNDGIKVDLPVKSLISIKVGAKYLDRSKAVVNDNLITHPELENGDFVTVEYIYDDSPIYGVNSISYLSLEEILDELWLENVYTYKVTNGEWELVKITDIEDYEEWLKTEKTSPYTLAPDGVIFGKYEADTKFIRQFPSSLYVDFIAPDRLKEGVTQIKARALVGTKNGVIDRPSRYFKITWLKRALRPGQQDIVIGTGDEIIVDVGEKDAITIEIEDLGILKSK